MVKRNFSQLAVYEIKIEAECIPLEHLRKLYLEKTSEIIYVVKDNKLYGIVCMAEVLYGHKLNPIVKINRTYTVLTGFNIIKAHEIFRSRSSINKIPVVNREGELIGDYSRWNDMLYIEQNHGRLIKEKKLTSILETYETVYVVIPVSSKCSGYLYMLNMLEKLKINYQLLDKGQISGKLREKAICIFLNEDEKRGIQCLYGLEPVPYDMRGYNTFRFDKLRDESIKITLTTYKGLIMRVMLETRMERLEVKKNENIPYEAIDEKAVYLLSALEKKGIKCFNLYLYEHNTTEYAKKFQNDIIDRLKSTPLKQEIRMWTESVHKEIFYGELYNQKDYKTGVAQDEIYNAVYSMGYKREISGKYFNARNGRRLTCFQPEEYIGTIYLFGLCMMIGLYVEDKYTIASYLQKRLLEKGYLYRVENCGSMLRFDADIDSRLEEIGQYHMNDIIIDFSSIGEAVGIRAKSLEKIYEEKQIPLAWVTDAYTHCNHNANQAIADGILEWIEPDLLEQAGESIHNRNIEISIHDIMQEYIQRKYLNQYFLNFFGSQYCTVGAIVMNCNPFSKGHRYLIEQAAQQVDFVIVFVVEEDESLFPFEERFKMIQEGVRNLDNIMVVPSGEFILSKNNFKEYFSKQEDETLSINAEYDIHVFADYIAGQLHITHRFVGEEPEDKVTKAYNRAMKKILPPKGIAYVEIPRIMVNDEIVSASRVRKYLRDEEYSKAFALLPDTTVQYLAEQL